jgi:DNA polymerase V
LEKIFREGYFYQKAGVMLTNLLPQGNLQLSLFEKGEDTLEKVGRQRQLMQAVDDINKRFGKDTVIVGATGLKRDWKMRQAYLSKQFTTSWDELLKVV